MNETPQIAMVQLSYFVNMVKHNLDPRWQERFWSLIRENCPDLIQAIDASFRSRYGWGEITFAWDLPSPAFDRSLIEGDPEESESRQQ